MDYRSFRNTPTLVGGDPQAALALIFGEGVFDFEAGEGEQFGGSFDMGGGYPDAPGYTASFIAVEQPS